MNRPIGTDKTFQLLRELPAEVTLEHVGSMVAAFPLVAPAASWLSHNLSRLRGINTNTIVMTSATTLIVGASVFLYNTGKQTPQNVRTQKMVPVQEQMVAPMPEVVETAPKTYPLPTARSPLAAVVVPKEVKGKKKAAPKPAPLLPAPVVASIAPIAMVAPTPKLQPMVVVAPTPGREFDLKGFAGVKVLGYMDVSLEQGEFAVTAEGDADWVAALQLSVKGQELVVAMKDDNGGENQGKCSKQTVVVYVHMPKLERMELTGSGDVHANGFDASGPVFVQLSGSGDMHINTFKGLSALSIRLDGSGDVFGEGSAIAGLTKIELAGSGDVRMEGSTEELEVSVVGSGDVDASEMKAHKCRVNVVGSGDVAVNCSGDADSKISGSGTINNSGNGGGNGAQGVENRSY